MQPRRNSKGQFVKTSKRKHASKRRHHSKKRHSPRRANHYRK